MNPSPARMKRAVATLLALLCLAFPAGALAAGPDPPAAVAGPTPSGAVLFAWDEGRRLCFGVGTRDDLDPRGRCLSRPPRNAEQVAIEHAYLKRGSTIDFAVVPASVGRVEVRYHGGARLDAGTSAGPAYTGRWAGKVRFLVGEHPTTTDEADTVDQVFLERYLALDGSLLFVRQPEFAQGPRIGAPLRFARTRGWRAYASVYRELVPTPFRPERFEHEVCLSVRARGLAMRRVACRTREQPPEDLVLQPEQGCRALAFAGFAGPEVARLEAVLTDGRRRDVTLHALPADRFGAARAFMLLFRGATGLRRVVAYDADGHRLRTGDVGMIPSAFSCGLSSFLDIVVAPAPDAPPPAGPPQFLVATRGDELCTGVDRLEPSSCWIPSAVLDRWSPVRVFTAARAAGSLVAGVARPDVASVEIRFADGRRERVATVDGLGDPGPWRGHVRFFELRRAGLHKATSVRPYDRAGRALREAIGYEGERPAPRVREVLRHRGFALGRAQVRYGKSRYFCAELAAGRVGRDPDDCWGTTELLASAFCSPRRLVLWGERPHDVARVVVVLRDGSRHVAPTTRLPRDPQLWLLVLGPRAAVREVRFVGGRHSGRTVADLPAAGRECGWSDWGSVSDPWDAG